MPYIAPESLLQIYTGIKLDKFYQNTLFFDTPSEQEKFFDNHQDTLYVNFDIRTKQLIDGYTFIRHTNNAIRIAANVNTLLAANYMRFKNKGGIWFYCFVDSVEYVNEEETLLTYTVDVIQTYFIGNSCFGDVIREHTSSDTIGENVIKEDFDAQPNTINSPVDTIPIEIGYYILVNSIPSYENGDYILRTPNPTIKNNILSAGYALCYHSSQINPEGGQSEFLEDYSALTRYEGTILSMGVIPAALISDNRVGYSTASGTYNAYKLKNNPLTATVEPYNAKTLPKNIQGYTPLNNKLFTSQFLIGVLNNNRGSQFEFLPELMAQIDGVPTIGFTLYITPSIKPSVTIQPTYYGNPINSTLGQHNTDGFRISIDDFPIGLFSFDTYSTWYNQNKNSIANSYISNGVSTLTSILALAASASTFGIPTGVAVGGALASGALKYGATTAKISDMKAAPDRIGGAVVDNDYIYITAGEKTNNTGFRVYYLSINRENAEMIDAYFSRYGYKINKTKQPEIFKKFPREIFSYLQCSNATLEYPYMPAEDYAKIVEILNNGITFWKSGYHSWIGKYDRNTFERNIIV